jgi:hypothetical protein
MVNADDVVNGVAMEAVGTSVAACVRCAAGCRECAIVDGLALEREQEVDRLVGLMANSRSVTLAVALARAFDEGARQALVRARS